MPADKGTGFDRVPRKGLKILYLVCPFLIHAILWDRLMMSDDPFYYINRIFFKWKEKPNAIFDLLINWRPISVISALNVPNTKYVYQIL